ncbi:MAG: pseudaminic acid cytidylyltransferase [Lachnospiraceae bacterium]|nr:pseudaminic acid cytidylyltransferase [Lachnospiraceae bacterium]
MKSAAIITARGGSKRIPRKNIKPFLGRPIIEYSIEAALRADLFDEVMVSTDDEEIAQVAERAGAKVPFFRSEKTSNDFATTADVIAEVIEAYEQIGKNFHTVCCIYPTAPFVTADTIRTAMMLLEQEMPLSQGRADCVIPVVKFSFPPQRGVVVHDGILSPMWPENMAKRSQDLEPLYHDCGQFYCLNVESFRRQKAIWMENAVPFVQDEKYVQDIDTLEDWEIAEMKYQLLMGTNLQNGNQ